MGLEGERDVGRLFNPSDMWLTLFCLSFSVYLRPSPPSPLLLPPPLPSPSMSWEGLLHLENETRASARRGTRNLLRCGGRSYFKTSAQQQTRVFRVWRVYGAGYTRDFFTPVCATLCVSMYTRGEGGTYEGTSQWILQSTDVLRPSKFDTVTRLASWETPSFLPGRL